MVAIDAAALRPVYAGRLLTADDLARLQASGQATISANNRELACQGISLYFNTEAQRESHLRDFQRRHSALRAASAQAIAGSRTARGNPCTEYAAAPSSITSTR